MRHIISILVENEFGALSRIAGLFTERRYNIESLAVAPTDDPSLSRITLVTNGNDQIIEQIIKQLNKLLDVVKVMDMTEGAHIEREMMLVKVLVPSYERSEEHTSELQSRGHLVCRLLLEKKKFQGDRTHRHR